MTDSTSELTHVLITCLRCRFDPAAVDAARGLLRAPGFDGGAFRERAVCEEVAPLLYATLRGKDVLPAEVEEALRRVYFAQAGRSLLAFRELGAVLKALQDGGVDVIVLKGAALAETVYGNPGVRPMCDVDLYVKEIQVPDALDILVARDYTIIPPRGYKAEVSLRPGTASGLLLELHWNLFVLPYYRYALPRDWFWRTAMPLVLSDGSQALMLGWEAQLLHLCGHLHLHHAGGGEVGRLLWLHDIAEIIEQVGSDLDWVTTVSIAQEAGLATALRDTLGMVIRLWGLCLPEEVGAALGDLVPSPVEQRVLADLNMPVNGLLDQVRKDLGALPDWRSRLHFLWTNFFPPPRYMRALYRLDGGVEVLASYLRRWREVG